MGDARDSSEIPATRADANRASFTSLVRWESRTGETILLEERTQTVFGAIAGLPGNRFQRRGAAPAER